MEVYGDTREEAEHNVRRSDTARAAYYRSIFGRDWGNRSNYDLMVDSSIGIKDTADVICRYIASKRSK